MKCPRCQTENDAGARFCEDCGARLEWTCPSCGTPVTPGKKFCRSCGAALTTEPADRFASPESYTPKHIAEKIITSKAALEGERKFVTILFADLKGSMELLANRDPEEARKLLDPVLERMMEAVHRYEGTVNQVMGDGIMALFGAPLAHEDHAVRACYAALRMQESVKKYAEDVRRSHAAVVNIRVGLNSGEVVVRAIGSDLHMDYTAVGQTTHLAARMEQMAAPGTILLTRETLAAVEDFVRTSPLGPSPVKGLPAPVEVFELTGASAVRSRLQAAAVRGLTPFVGREAETTLLRRALERAASGRGQVVALAGEPGVGKSRAIWELTRSPGVRDWLVLEGPAISYGQNSSYLPVIALLKRYAQIDADDDAPSIREKLHGKLLSLDPQLAAALPAMLSLLDVPVDDASWQRLDPPQRRRHTLESIKRLLLRLSQAQPLLLVFEDLHWIDSETQALLDGLVDSVPAARVLLLVSYRPEYTHTWGAKTYCHQLRLDVLTSGTADALLGALVGRDPDLAALKALLIERTDGNPFFLEEAVRALAETGTLLGERGQYRLAGPVAGLPIPATAQALLAARIDRLAPEDKRLLQAAAVIGKTVPLPLLEAVGELAEEQLRAGLARLQAAELLYEAQIFPDLEYTFKHALTHEVTYGGLLAERRVALHGALVAAYERLHRDRLGEHVERLAQHAMRGERWDKAAAYAHAAGRRCIERSAYRDAITHLENAAAAAERLPDGREQLERAIDVRLDLRAARLAVLDGPRAFEGLVEAEPLARRLGDHNRLAIVTIRMAHLLWLAGQTEAAQECRRRVLEDMETVTDPEVLISVHSVCGVFAVWWAEYALVETHARRVIDLLGADHARTRGDGITAPAVQARGLLAAARSEQGQFDAAIQIGEEAVQIAESLHHPHSLVQAITYLTWVQYHRGDYAEGVRLCEQGLALASGDLTLGGTFAVPFLRGILAYFRTRSGAGEAGLASIREVIQAQTAIGVRAGLSLMVSWLSEGLMLVGRLDEATAEAARGLALVTDCGERRGQATFHQILGDIAARRVPLAVEPAAAQYRLGIELATALGARPVAAHCHLGLGRLLRHIGKRVEADEHLATATTMYRDMGMTYWQTQTETVMNERV